MRRTQITEGFYWIDRLYFGLTIGKVSMFHDCDGRVTFPGSSACYHIGTPDACNPTRIASKRFKAKVEDYVFPARRVVKESWE